MFSDVINIGSFKKFEQIFLMVEFQRIKEKTTFFSLNTEISVFYEKNQITHHLTGLTLDFQHYNNIFLS